MDPENSTGDIPEPESNSKNIEISVVLFLRTLADLIASRDFHSSLWVPAGANNHAVLNLLSAKLYSLFSLWDIMVLLRIKDYYQVSDKEGTDDNHTTNDCQSSDVSQPVTTRDTNPAQPSDQETSRPKQSPSTPFFSIRGHNPMPLPSQRSASTAIGDVYTIDQGSLGHRAPIQSNIIRNGLVPTRSLRPYSQRPGDNDILSPARNELPVGDGHSGGNGKTGNSQPAVHPRWSHMLQRGDLLPAMPFGEHHDAGVLGKDIPRPPAPNSPFLTAYDAAWSSQSESEPEYREGSGPRRTRFGDETPQSTPPGARKDEKGTDSVSKKKIPEMPKFEDYRKAQKEKIALAEARCADHMRRIKEIAERAQPAPSTGSQTVKQPEPGAIDIIKDEEPKVDARACLAFEASQGKARRDAQKLLGSAEQLQRRSCQETSKMRMKAYEAYKTNFREQHRQTRAKSQTPGESLQQPLKKVVNIDHRSQNVSSTPPQKTTPSIVGRVVARPIPVRRTAKENPRVETQEAHRPDRKAEAMGKAEGGRADPSKKDKEDIEAKKAVETKKRAAEMLQARAAKVMPEEQSKIQAGMKPITKANKERASKVEKGARVIQDDWERVELFMMPMHRPTSQPYSLNELPPPALDQSQSKCKSQPLVIEDLDDNAGANAVSTQRAALTNREKEHELENVLREMENYGRVPRKTNEMAIRNNPDRAESGKYVKKQPDTKRQEESTLKSQDEVEEKPKEITADRQKSAERPAIDENTERPASLSCKAREESGTSKGTIHNSDEYSAKESSDEWEILEKPVEPKRAAKTSFREPDGEGRQPRSGNFLYKFRYQK